jgi:hypothetical protein
MTRLMSRQGRVPHDAFEGEEKVAQKKEKVLGDEHPVVDDDEEDLDPTYSKA